MLLYIKKMKIHNSLIFTQIFFRDILYDKRFNMLNILLRKSFLINENFALMGIQHIFFWLFTRVLGLIIIYKKSKYLFRESYKLSENHRIFWKEKKNTEKMFSENSCLTNIRYLVLFSKNIILYKKEIWFII